ncbi:MAG TPA: beta-propeller domain-containing protein [Candidatus Angelobacter sp.]|nr:beta-propeller domain-containing protein [Candidatus Angelobacter sp.]
MKTPLTLVRWPGWWSAAVGLFFVSLLALAGDSPSITSIRLDGTNVVVTAQVPAGIHRVTLECRSRLGAGTWEPRAVTRLDGTGGEVTFLVPRTATLEVLRVRADDQEPLPAAFYSGTNSFTGQPVSPGGLDGVFDGAPTAAPGADPAAGTGAPSRDVVESDIWKVSGDTLYFFNQYRGLQIIDISMPDSAVVKGVLPLPAAGEQMYLLDSNHVVLLAQDGCNWWGGDSESRILVVNVAGGAPQVTASIPVSGYIQESRLVGTALYVASQSYQIKTNSANSVTWEAGTVVSSFDLGNLESPVPKNTLWFPGYDNVIAATDVFLFVAVTSADNYWRSIVHCLDITAPDGTMNHSGSVSTSGRVNDKFKMNRADSVFTVVSEVPATSGATWTTKLETFLLPDPRGSGPAGITKLGTLALGNGERVFATRFDGDLVYVVTFRRIDPLWVVDISDAAHPKIAGELQVPGYSTFIQPLGDRLVTVGIDDTNSWRVAVSLFDVHDPAAPSLLSEVALGQNYSWSEANTDEKAFNVMPDEHLILLPYQGYFTNGYASRIQLVDLNRDSLTLRGTIDHETQPRRATVHGDRILSLSGQELLSVDATDRDHPQIKADLPLAWSVDQVFVQNGYLIELSTASSWWWLGQPKPAVRITSANEPDRVLNEIDLPNQFPILGAATRDGRLYLAQGEQNFGPIPLADGTDPGQPTNDAPNLFVSIYDVSALPEVKLLGATAVMLDPLGWGANFQIVWPRAGVLVLAGGGGGYWDPWLDFGIATPAGGTLGPAGGGIARPIFWGNNGGRLIAFDVSNTATPKFLSDVNLAENTWWSFSPAYTVNGQVYLSHEAVEPCPPVVTNDKDTNSAPVYYWVQRWYLDVVDYADATNPTIRKPVNIPGSLNGVARAGELLYTVGQHWTDPTNWFGDGREYLDASAYDGVEAHLVDSLPLSSFWPHPVLVKDDNVFLGHPTETNTVKNLLEAWTLPDSGKFTLLGKAELSGAVQNFVSFGDLLAAQIGNEVGLFDVANPASPAPLVTGGPPGCVWFDLSKADGAPGRGLWLPLGVYGVSMVLVPPAP